MPSPGKERWFVGGGVTTTAGTVVTRSHQAEGGVLLGLARGILEAANRYGQAKQNVSWPAAELETQVWEEFGEAIEEDFWSALKRFWQTVRRGKGSSTCTVYSAGGVLLT